MDDVAAPKMVESREKIVDEQMSRWPDGCKELGFARRLRERVLEVNHRANVPADTDEGLQGWASTFDLIHRRGTTSRGAQGYPWEAIGELLRFTFQDSFWRTTIRGPASFRRSIVQIENKMNRLDGGHEEEVTLDTIEQLLQGDDP